MHKQELVSVLKEKKVQVVKSQNYELAAKLRDEERKVLEKLDDEKIKWSVVFK